MDFHYFRWANCKRLNKKARLTSGASQSITHQSHLFTGRTPLPRGIVLTRKGVAVLCSFGKPLWSVCQHLALGGQSPDLFQELPTPHGPLACTPGTGVPGKVTGSVTSGGPLGGGGLELQGRGSREGGVWILKSLGVHQAGLNARVPDTVWGWEDAVLSRTMPWPHRCSGSDNLTVGNLTRGEVGAATVGHSGSERGSRRRRCFG